MIRLSCNLSQKMPIPGVDFSSQNVGAEMQIEVSDSAGTGEIRQKIQQIYKLLEHCIKEQLDSVTGSMGLPLMAKNTAFLNEFENPNQLQSKKELMNNSAENEPVQFRNINDRDKKGWKDAGVTQAQSRAIYAISKAKKVPDSVFKSILNEAYQVDDPKQLTKKQASDLIKKLQSFVGPDR